MTIATLSPVSTLDIPPPNITQERKESPSPMDNLPKDWDRLMCALETENVALDRRVYIRNRHIAILEAEIERLREALRTIQHNIDTMPIVHTLGPEVFAMRAIYIVATAALKEDGT